MFRSCFVLMLLSRISSASTLFITSATADLTMVDAGFAPTRVCAEGPSTSNADCSLSGMQQVPIQRHGQFYGYEYFQADGTVMASSVFGALSGEITENLKGLQGLSGGNPFDLTENFYAGFNNLLLVTGGTGTGMLVAHYSWDFEASQAAPFTVGFDANFFDGFGISVGGTYPPGPLSQSGTFDVPVSFAFGQLMPIEAYMQGIATPHILSFSLSASLSLTGFSVYDAAGNLVPGAQVAPTIAPEPGSMWLLLCGTLGLLKLAVSHKYRAQRSGQALVSVGLG